MPAYNLLGPPARGQDIAKYNKEVDAAYEYFKEALPAEFYKSGHWQIMAMPDSYNHERIPNITTVVKLLSEAEVSLRGWNFPHTDKSNKSNFGNGRQSHTNFEQYMEAYRAYQSGLFIWRGAYREDHPDFAKKYGKALSLVNVIYEITEMFVFLKRYYERVAPEAAIHVSIELHDIEDRALVATDWEAMLSFGRYVSQARGLVIEQDYSVAELRASAEELATKVVQKIFEVFNWNDPDADMIRGWQQKLLSRTS